MNYLMIAYYEFRLWLMRTKLRLQIVFQPSAFDDGSQIVPAAIALLVVWYVYMFAFWR